MKKIIWMTVPALIAMSSSASAAEGVSGSAKAAGESGFFVSVGGSRLDIDLNDGTFRTSSGELIAGSLLNIDFDSAPMVSLTAGYNWGGWALELAYEHTLQSGDLEFGSTSVINGDFDYGNFRIGGAYRSSGKLYVIQRFGISLPDLNTDMPNAKFTLNNSGFLGLGAGYRLGPSSSAEFDYSRSNDDTGSFTLGWRQHF